MTPAHANEFTVLMAEIKQAMGPGKLMSECVGVFGLEGGGGVYPLLLDPWVNVGALDRASPDFAALASLGLARHRYFL